MPKIIVHCSKNAIGSPNGSRHRCFLVARRRASYRLRRLHLNAFGHHASAAAFTAAQSFDEVADGSAGPYAKAYEVAFGDDAFMPARQAPDQNALGRTRGHSSSVHRLSDDDGNGFGGLEHKENAVRRPSFRAEQGRRRPGSSKTALRPGRALADQNNSLSSKSKI
jgi:hypothetical protein